MSVHMYILSAALLFVAAPMAHASAPRSVSACSNDTLVNVEKKECCISSSDTISTKSHKVVLHRSKKNTKHKYLGSLGLYGGFLHPLGAPQWMQTDMAASNEIGFELELYRSYNSKRNRYFSLGLDFDWRNYRTTGRQRFVQDEAENLVMTSYPTKASRTYSSRIKTFSVGIPLRYTFVLPKHWRVDVAAVVRFNTFATAESYYDVPDAAMQVNHHVKESYSHLHQTPVSVDFKARLLWRFIGMYATYSPCRVLNADYGPKFTPFSVGAVFSL